MPLAMGSSPAQVRRRVVLPAPLGPSSRTTSPAATSRSTPARAGKRPSRAPGATPTTGGGASSTTTVPGSASTLPAGPAPPPTGEALAVIRIPRIGIEKAVVQGVSLEDLKRGPGHYPGTPVPGQPGNAAIAGHRTTYGAPFFRLDEMQPGDPIFVTTPQGSFVYQVQTKQVIGPKENSVLLPSTDNRLTLTR